MSFLPVLKTRYNDTLNEGYSLIFELLAMNNAIKDLQTECKGCPDKLNTIRQWVYLTMREKGEVLVTECTYPCIVEKDSVKVRTVICLPDMLPEQGIFSIDKPCAEVGIEDIISIYTRLNANA